MRVYNKKEFLDLPTGTFFCKGMRWDFSGMSIRGIRYRNSYLYVNLSDIDWSNSDQRVSRYVDSLENGTSYELESDAIWERDIDEETLFLVFEETDLEFLVTFMNLQIKYLNAIKKDLH